MNKEQLTELVTRAQKGDKTAMDRLFEAYYNDVYYFALKTLKDSDLACDITQETFLEILNSIGKLQEPAAFVTWMKQIAYFRCTRYFAKHKEVTVEEDEDGNTVFDTLADESEGVLPQEVVEKEEFRRTVLEMIDRLTEEQRSAVLLYYFDELTVGQIARIQNVSEGTVKSRLNYARKAIRKSVEDYERKNGIRLHSFALLPLLLLLLPRVRMPEGKAAAVRKAVLSGVKVGGFMAKLARIPLAGKLVAGVTAAALVVGVGAAIANPGQKPEADGKKETAAVRQTGSYESELLTEHAGTSRYSDVFEDFADFNCAYIRTTDGELVSLRPSGTDWEGESERFGAQTWDMVGITPIFYDAQGLLHAIIFEEAIPCPDIRGRLLHITSSWTETSDGTVEEYFANVISEEGDRLWMTCCSKNGAEQWPVLICDVDTMALYEAAECTVVTAREGVGVILRFVVDGMVYETTRREPTDTSALVGKEGNRVVYVECTGVRIEDLLSDLTSGERIWKNEERNVICIQDQPVAMPDGRSVAQIDYAGGSSRGIVRFSDGAIYLYGMDGQQGLVYSWELTELQRAGRIRQFRLQGGKELLLVMDNNVTYTLAGRMPEQPSSGNNQEAAPPTTEAEKEKTPLPQALEDVTFTLNGREFHLGIRLSELVASGVYTDIKYYDEELEGLERSAVSLTLDPGGKARVLIYVWNLSGGEIDIHDATVTGIEYFMEDWTEAEKAAVGPVSLNGVALNTTVSDIVEIFGEPNIHEKTWDHDTERSGGWRGFDIGEAFRLNIVAEEAAGQPVHNFYLEFKPFGD